MLRTMRSNASGSFTSSPFPSWRGRHRSSHEHPRSQRQCGAPRQPQGIIPVADISSGALASEQYRQQNGRPADSRGDRSFRTRSSIRDQDALFEQDTVVLASGSATTRSRRWRTIRRCPRSCAIRQFRRWRFDIRKCSSSSPRRVTATCCCSSRRSIAADSPPQAVRVSRQRCLHSRRQAVAGHDE